MLWLQAAIGPRFNLLGHPLNVSCQANLLALSPNKITMPGLRRCSSLRSQPVFLKQALLSDIEATPSTCADHDIRPRGRRP